MIDSSRYSSIDLPLYNRQLRDFLPERIYDCHVHIGLPEHIGPISPERKAAMWALEVGEPLSVAALAEVQSLLFPGKSVRSLAFAMPVRECDLTAANAYTSHAVASDAIDGLLVTDPTWSAETLAGLLDSGGFLGLKPYPDLVLDKSGDEVGIFDCLPDSHLELANERRLIVMLHIPRRERLRDPRNQDELREIASRFPNIKLIVAHIGRSYTMTYAEPGLCALSDCESLYYDFAANLNPDVLALALQIVGPQRLLYGSDLPVMLMRGVREHEGDFYHNFTDGPYSWNLNRKPPQIEAQYTFYLYEQLLAFKRAAEQVGISAEDVADVMAGNALRLIAP